MILIEIKQSIQTDCTLVETLAIQFDDIHRLFGLLRTNFQCKFAKLDLQPLTSICIIVYYLRLLNLVLEKLPPFLSYTNTIPGIWFEKLPWCLV